MLVSPLRNSKTKSREMILLEGESLILLNYFKQLSTKFWFSEFGQMAKRLRSVHGHIVSSAMKRQNERLNQSKLYNIK